jgi:hypothetical protein
MERSDNDLNSDTGYVIKVLQQYRHDWMNQMQMLYAYGQLQRWDQLMNAMKIMIETSELERKILHIGLDDVTLFLITNMHQYSSIRLDVEVHRLEFSNLQSKKCPLLILGFKQLFDLAQECMRVNPLSFLSVRICFREEPDVYHINVAISSDLHDDCQSNDYDLMRQVIALMQKDESITNAWQTDVFVQENVEFQLSAKFDMIHECMMPVEK